jgi:hypothetical protein
VNDYSTLGPFDSEQLDDVRPYIDFGSIRVEPMSDLSISVDVEDGTSRVVAVTLDYSNSKLQLMAFAAPKTEGIWSDIRSAVAQNILAPLVDDQGRAAGHRLARFVGFDGPRWCLRGTIGGAAMTDPKAAADINDLFRSVIVHRGDTPLPPGEALPLSVPAGSVLPPGMKA